MWEELCHIETSFRVHWLPKMAIETNTWLFWKQQQNHNNNINNENQNDTNLNRLSDEIVQTLKLTYKGEHDIDLIKAIKTSTKKSLPEKQDVKDYFNRYQYNFQININNDTNKQHKHDLVYFSKCISSNCADRCIAETVRQLSKWTCYGHTVRDIKYC